MAFILRADVLRSIVRAAKVEFEMMTEEQLMTVVRFSAAPIFWERELVFPGPLGEAYAEEAPPCEAVVKSRYSRGRDRYALWQQLHEPAVAFRLATAVVRSVWLRTLLAVVAAGYEIEDKYQPLVDAFAGIGKLTTLAADPAAFASICELAPHWDGTAGELAATVQSMATLAPPAPDLS